MWPCLEIESLLRLKKKKVNVVIRMCPNSIWLMSFKKNLYLFICLFLNFIFDVLGLCCCTKAFWSCGEWELVSNCGMRDSHWGVFSCCRALALELGLSSCSTQASLLPGPGMEAMSPALAGRFLTTGPSEKSSHHFKKEKL